MAYLHPGVYVEEIPSGSKPIEGVATSVTAFVGRAGRGPVDSATPISSWDEYVAVYGPITRVSDAMGLAVAAFYQNGGKDAYIARVAAAAPIAAPASLAIRGQDAANADVIKVHGASPGTWGSELHLRLSKDSVTSLAFKLEVGRRVDGVFTVDETFRDLVMDSGSPDFVLTRINGNSRQVRVSLLPAADPADAQNQYQLGSLTGIALATAADFFSTSLRDDMVLTLNIDGRGAKQISLGKKVDLGLAGTDNKVDGDKVVARIVSQVKTLGPQDCYQQFACEYTARKFTLTSGKKSPSSSVAVFDGDGSETDVAKVLGLNSAANTVAVFGAAKVVPRTAGSDPANPTGVNNQGVPLAGGVEGDPSAADYRSALAGLAKIRDISVLVLPGKVLPDDKAFIDVAVAHCEATRNRMLIVDSGKDKELATPSDVEALLVPSSTYAVLYYPWVISPNPLYHPDINPLVDKSVAVGPAASVAGIWSKTDGRRGVWKAPAGVETGLLGVIGLRYTVDDSAQDKLNPIGVNCLRVMPSFGPVVWGARTLAVKASPEWKYVPVRRTAIMIEQSIFNGIQWAVFEPNDHRLWSSLRLNIEAFMNGLFRAGAFQGEKVSDAYFVRCGLGDTMTQGDIDAGQVIVTVGFAPLKPAEFVIVRIQQKAGQQ